ncbi:MAG: exodeoxyribonuclease VII small subunit [Clostridia bacterium]|nr:exodeoxyribonuclease VII small subunit [Clostridia bacterium]
MAEKKTATDVTNEKPIELESAMKRLDEVVARLSGEGVELEEALALYEEGVRLVRECNARLESAKRKINMLRMNSDGEITEEAFDN